MTRVSRVYTLLKEVTADASFQLYLKLLREIHSLDKTYNQSSYEPHHSWPKHEMEEWH